MGKRDHPGVLMFSFDPFCPFHMTHLIVRDHWPFVMGIHGGTDWWIYLTMRQLYAESVSMK